MGSWGFAASQGTKKCRHVNWWLLGPSQTPQEPVPFSHCSLNEPLVKILSILERIVEIFQTMIIMCKHKWLFLSFFTFWEQFIDIAVNALSIRAVYWRKMFQNIPNIHILWAFIWVNELRLKANGCIICSRIYFPTEIDMQYVADCIARQHIFHDFDWKIKSRAVRKPLLSHQERCLVPRNQYAASLRQETVTILQRALGTVRCGHAPFTLFTLLPLFSDKLPNSKRIVMVPKCYIEIDLNFLKWITNGCSSETHHSCITCF